MREKNSTHTLSIFVQARPHSGLVLKCTKVHITGERYVPPKITDMQDHPPSSLSPCTLRKCLTQLVADPRKQVVDVPINYSRIKSA